MIVDVQPDFCIRYPVEDTHRLGFEAVVIEGACHAIGTANSLGEMLRSFLNLGITTFAHVDLETQSNAGAGTE